MLLAMDVSRSMGATDVKPTRLRAAQTAAHEFVYKMPNKFRVGVVSFSTLAQVAVPPTQIARSSATRSTRCTRARARRSATPSRSPSSLGQRQRADGVVPPTSDPAHLRRRARRRSRAAAGRRRQAKALHVPVYTILLGTPAGVVQHKLPGGYTETIRVPPSAQTLQMIARTSGGQFFTASNDKRLRRGVRRSCARGSGTRRNRARSPTSSPAARRCSCSSPAALSAFWFRRVP